MSIGRSNSPADHALMNGRLSMIRLPICAGQLPSARTVATASKLYW